MGYVEGRCREQIELVPMSLEERIVETNPIRVIDAFVEGLDMEQIQFTYAKPSWTGRPAYNPQDMLKLYLYGYVNRIRSSRRLMRECRRNIEVMCLMNELTPDFRTIADFRKDNRKAIKEAFH